MEQKSDQWVPRPSLKQGVFPTFFHGVMKTYFAVKLPGPTLILRHAFATFGIQLTRSPEVMPDDRIVAAWNFCD